MADTSPLHFGCGQTRGEAGHGAGGDSGRRAELLAPAGDAAALQAALSAGADAVYLGLRRWSARAQAANFDEQGLLEAIERAHLWGARVYLALNTLLKDVELEPALAALERPYRAGLDAVLVADLGLAEAIRRRYPDLAVHGSTQLCCHSSAQLAMLARAGFRRVVLARELSLGEIGSLDTHGLEIEVFVHGALCYGYSGLCLFSSMVGGRSGNRGRCAQACRLHYRLVDPGRPSRPISEGRVLSTSDLAALDRLPELIELGVKAFKIEGRMKDAAYVSIAVETYREALDAALADPAGYRVRPEWRERLEQSFSRSFTTAHLEGRHDRIRSGGRGGHRGAPVGRVMSLDAANGRALVSLARPLAAGDVIVVYTRRGHTDPIVVEAPADDVVMIPLRPGVAPRDRVFRIVSRQIDDRARELVAGRRVVKPELLEMRLSGRSGGPARLRVRALGVRALGRDAPGRDALARGTSDQDTSGRDAAGEEVLRTSSPKQSATVEVVSRRPLESAERAALTEARVRQALGALGGTPYELHMLHLDVPDGSFLPVGELKGLRRRAVAALNSQRLSAWRRQASAARCSFADVVAGRRSDARHSADRAAISSTIVRLRPGEQPVLGPGVSVVCLDLSLDDAPEAVEAALCSLASRGLSVRCRPPAVLFDQHCDWWRAIAKMGWQAVVARHAAHLHAAAPVVLEYPLVGLSPCGVLALVRHEHIELAGVVLSPELRLNELSEFAEGLASFCPGSALEVLAFGRQEVLLSRDRLGAVEDRVVFDAVAPVHLRLCDARGYEFPVIVDRAGTCVYNALTTNLARYVDVLQEAGVTGFIVEQAALGRDESAAFCRTGIEGLARFADPARSTTAHLFRGVE